MFDEILGARRLRALRDLSLGGVQVRCEPRRFEAICERRRFVGSRVDSVAVGLGAGSMALAGAP